MTEYITPPRNPLDPIELQRFFEQICRLCNAYIDGVWGTGSTVKGGQIVEGGTGGLLEAATVTTQAVTDVDETIAIGNGNITDLGDPYPTQHGVCWSKTALPTIMDNKTEEGAAAATGAFTTEISGLTAGTKYYVRAYATNAYGTSYGAEVEVTKEAVLPSDANLVLHYKFDETTGTTADDAQENYDGTLTNFPVDNSQWVAGQTNNALDFDGSDDYIDVGDPLESTFQDSFSISLWFKADDGRPVGSQYLLLTNDTNNQVSVRFGLTAEANTLQILYKSDGDQVLWLSTSGIFDDGPFSAFKHLVITVESGGSIKVYIDSVLQSTNPSYPGDMSSVVMAAYSCAVNLKLSTAIAGYRYDGKMDELRIYNAVLTAEEVLALYNNDL